METEKLTIEPSVSVIMPNYNCGEYIAESIASVCQQTYQNWELLIYDNGSEDESVDIIKQFAAKDNRIKLIPFQQAIPKGAAYARNMCLEHSNADYIAFLDADDLWKQDKLARQIRFMQAHAIDFSYTHYTIINARGEMIVKECIKEAKTIYNKALRGHEIGLLTVVIRNSARLGKVRFPTPQPNKEFHEDTALWFKLLQKIEAAYLFDEYLTLYRCHKDSKNFNKLTSIRYFYRTLRYSERFSTLKSIGYLLRYIAHGVLRKGKRVILSYLRA